MRRTILTIMILSVAALGGGCISIPEPGPIHSLAYEYDKDKQQWTKTRCVVITKLGKDTHSMDSVCRKEIIDAPPTGIEKQVAE